MTNAAIAGFDLHAAQPRQALEEPAEGLGSEIMVLLARGAGVAAGVDAVEFGMGLEVAGQTVGRVPLVIDAAVRIESDAAKNANAVLVGNGAQLLSGVNAAVTVAQQAPDDDGIDPVAATPTQQGGA